MESSQAHTQIVYVLITLLYVCGGESVLIWTSTNLRHQHFYTIELVREQKIFCDTAAVRMPKM